MKDELSLFKALAEVTEYRDGRVYWSVRGRGRTVGKEVGTSSNGYRQVQICGYFIRVHRYVYWLNTGEVPLIIDHVKGDKLDNVNIRNCTQTQNTRNMRVHKDNKVGFKGVNAHQGMFRATIMKDGKKIHIGCYPTPEEASDAYYKKAKELFGDFANRGQ